MTTHIGRNTKLDQTREDWDEKQEVQDTEDMPSRTWGPEIEQMRVFGESN